MYTGKVEVEKVAEYFNDQQNRDTFAMYLAECYQNYSVILERVLSTNDTVFILKSNEFNSKIMAYFFCSDKEHVSILLNELSTKFIYNGYSFVKEDYRKGGALKILLFYVTSFYVKKYNIIYSQVLLYAVTSSPFALRGYYKALDTVRPLLDGSLTENDLDVARFLEEKLFVSTSKDNHPFVLKTNLQQRYKRSVIDSFVKSNLYEAKFLNHLGIDESKGDRFLFYWTALTSTVSE